MVGLAAAAKVHLKLPLASETIEKALPGGSHLDGALYSLNV